MKKQNENNMEKDYQTNEGLNYFISELSNSLGEKQKEMFETWCHKAVDYLLKDEKKLDDNFANVVFALLKQLAKMNYDFSDFDFDECKLKFFFFLDNLEGSKFSDIEAYAGLMTISYFMEKRFYINEKKPNR